MTTRPEGDSQSPLRRTVLFAAALGAATVRASLVPAGTAIEAGRAVERQTRRIVGDVAGQVGLGALDVVLASRFTDEAVKRVLRSPAPDERSSAHSARPWPSRR